MKRLCWAVGFAILSAAAMNAADLGDPAAPLEVAEWVKGSPVKIADGKGKNIYVVEFWATWCPPCLTSIPHLTELQKKYKDKGLVFIGISNEKPKIVKKFVEKMGSKMDYTVAIDGGKTSEAYMAAFDQEGIPQAFVVDKEGRVVWRGSPLIGMERAIETLLSGKYDIAKARDEIKKLDEVPDKVDAYVSLLTNGGDETKAKQLEDELVALEKEFGNILGGKPFNPEQIRKQLKFGDLAQRYQDAVVQNGSSNALAALEKEMESSKPEDFDMAEFKQQIAQALETRKVVTIARDYFAAVGDPSDAAKAAELSKQLQGTQLENPKLFGEIAWVILTEDAIKKRDTQLALTLAKRAVDTSKEADPEILDTYARALFDNGNADEAIVQQKKAIELADGEAMEAFLKQSLEKYETKARESK